MESTSQSSGLLRGRSRSLVVAAVLILMAVSWLGAIDRASTDYIDNSLVQASESHRVLWRPFRLSQAATA